MLKKPERRKLRKKQRRINFQLRKKLLGDKEFADCCYCGITLPCKELTIEHKVPICLGGDSNIENIDIACAPCNQVRGREAWLKYLFERKRKDLENRVSFLKKKEIA